MRATSHDDLDNNTHLQSSNLCSTTIFQFFIAFDCRSCFHSSPTRNDSETHRRLLPMTPLSPPSPFLPSSIFFSHPKPSPSTTIHHEAGSCHHHCRSSMLRSAPTRVATTSPCSTHLLISIIPHYSPLSIIHPATTQVESHHPPSSFPSIWSPTQQRQCKEIQARS